jgi:hypothetical protein
LNNGILILLNTMGDIIFQWFGIWRLNQSGIFGLTQVLVLETVLQLLASWYFINNNPVKEYSAYNNAQMPNYIRTDLSVNYFFVKANTKECEFSCITL